MTKEEGFALLDEMIDAEVDITSLGKEFPKQKYDSIRMKFSRTFGSYKQALIEYGYYRSNGVPTTVELARCFEITEDYRVVTLKLNKSEVCDIYFLSDAEFNRVSKSLYWELRRDAIDNFYRYNFPFDKVSISNLVKEHRHLQRGIEKIYGSAKRMLSFYKTPYDQFIDRNAGASVRRGHLFEQKLGEILRAVYGVSAVNSQVWTDGCRPDFIVNGRRWIDAKLSSYTIHDTRCDTITKYRKHTDDLTIYFARGDRSGFDTGGCKLRHVSALYPLLQRAGRTDLIDAMETFINAVETPVKRRVQTPSSRRVNNEGIAE